MASQSFQSTYSHYVTPDGKGGGYAYIWHPGFDDAFNTYVFHFDASGFSTIYDTNGTPVHSLDPTNYYGNAYASALPVSHDLIIAYEQTDAYTQYQSRIYVNRITEKGQRLWDDGILVADYEGFSYSDIKVDAFEDGSGFTIIYTKSGDNPYFTTIEAVGMDTDGNQLWTRTMCSTLYRRTLCQNSTGFHLGQNVVAWVHCMNGGMYAQNIGTDGTLGPIEPVLPCLPPENFAADYVYDIEELLFGTQLSWTAPATTPLHYNLYRTDETNKEEIIIEVDAYSTSYFDDCGTGTYRYQLTAVYEDCESNFALTPDGEDHLIIEVTGMNENAVLKIIKVLSIYNMNGQRVETSDPSELPPGIYIIQGLTEDGRLVYEKTIRS